jgi:outer membrane protein
MKRSFKFIICLGMALFTPELFSQEILKIGHVNMSEIMTSLPESDSARMLLEKDTKELQQMLENMQVEYNKLIDDFDKNEAAYSELIKENKRNEIAGVQDKISKFQQNAQQQLQQRNNELIQPILQKIQKAIDKVATQEKFTYIFDISQGIVVYVSPDSHDINSLVISELGVKK